MVGGAPEPSLRLVEAWNEVMFNQQTKRECHYDTLVTNEGWSELYSNFFPGFKGQSTGVIRGNLKFEEVTRKSRDFFKTLYKKNEMS